MGEATNDAEGLDREMAVDCACRAILAFRYARRATDEERWLDATACFWWFDYWTELAVMFAEMCKIK
uniref:Uncharacterized protein n=1 Tax=viral metagenome TaxID=1070528 RepID=A0A6H1ZSX0_9ZZZZ